MLALGQVTCKMIEHLQDCAVVEGAVAVCRASGTHVPGSSCTGAFSVSDPAPTWLTRCLVLSVAVVCASAWRTISGIRMARMPSLQFCWWLGRGVCIAFAGWQQLLAFVALQAVWRDACFS